MKEKTYKIKLKTLSNLHIGSGEVFQTFDYYIKNSQFCFIDQDRLVDFLIENDKEEQFTKAVLSSERNVDRNIEPLLNSMGIQDLTPFTKYCLNGLPEMKDNKPRPTQIDGFLRNNNGEPFIPGSSIKGFISNCLGINIDDRYDKQKGNLFSISDSLPLQLDDLWVTKNGYYNHLADEVNEGIYQIGGAKDNKGKVKVNIGQSNYIEFIRPNTTIEFVLKVKNNEHFNIDSIKEAIQKVNKHYVLLYQEMFYETTRNDAIKYDPLFNNAFYKSRDVFRLGKHTNFLLKTEHLKNHEDAYDLYETLKRNRLIRFPGKARKKLEEHSSYYSIFPTALKVSQTPNLVYKENGVCSYEIEDITNLLKV